VRLKTQKKGLQGFKHTPNVVPHVLRTHAPCKPKKKKLEEQSNAEAVAVAFGMVFEAMNKT
jgi:hypothetical protein